MLFGRGDLYDCPPGTCFRDICLAMENEDRMVDPADSENSTFRRKRHIKKKISLSNLFKTICLTRDDCIDWLKNRGLIPKIMFCPTCTRKMKFEPNENSIDGYVWTCKECPVSPSRFSARHGSWLEGRDAPLVDILLFTYLWAHGFSELQISKETNMPLSAVKEWSITYLNICYSVYQRKVSAPENGDLNELEKKELNALIWRRKNKYKDPFLEFLKDADSL